MPRAEEHRRARAAGEVAAEQGRQRRRWARLKLEARLYGLGEAWHQLEAVRSLEATARSLPARDSYGVGEPDIDRQGRLVGVEAKGSGRGARSLSKHGDEARQLSRRANHKRAMAMFKKRPKIGKSSNRLGGPYTRDELDLYAFLDERMGMKRLLSVHTNTETGLTRSFERDGLGNIVPSSRKPLDEFILEDLRELKNMLTEKRGKK